jgi:hypothetical protein
MELTVYMEDWQLDCCGEPFAVGSQISWTLIQNRCSWIQDIISPDAGIVVAAREEHHGRLAADTPATRGTVNRIFAVCCQYAPPAVEAGPQQPVPGSGVLIPVTQAQRFGGHHYHHLGKSIGYVAQVRIA